VPVVSARSTASCFLAALLSILGTEALASTPLVAEPVATLRLGPRFGLEISPCSVCDSEPSLLREAGMAAEIELAPVWLATDGGAFGMGAYLGLAAVYASDGALSIAKVRNESEDALPWVHRQRPSGWAGEIEAGFTWGSFGTGGLRAATGVAVSASLAPESALLEPGYTATTARIGLRWRFWRWMDVHFRVGLPIHGAAEGWGGPGEHELQEGREVVGRGVSGHLGLSFNFDLARDHPTPEEAEGINVY
jgi:hypothetical protein